MFFTLQTVAALAAFAPLVSAHVRMVGPASVFSNLNLGKELDPLDPDGSNYPCFYTSGSSQAAPTWAAGSVKSIDLVGSAIHGGGSCQVSIAYPQGGLNKNTVFKVIQSYEGGCPAGSTTGNLTPNPDNILPSLSFTLPKDIPSGDAIISWTWFNKIGNREMYMRCAPVKISGGASDTTFFNQLPDMFKANINNGCTVPENGDLKFPNPGKNLIGAGNLDPVGSGCQKPGSPLPNLPVPIPTTTRPILVPVPTSITPPSATVPAVTTTVVVIPQKPTTTVVVIPQKPTSTSTTIAVPTGGPVPPKEAPKPSPPVGGACVDGSIVCTSATTWAMCNFGTLVPMGNTAAGLECADGRMVLAKRSVRFSHEHRRRHHSSN